MCTIFHTYKYILLPGIVKDMRSQIIFAQTKYIEVTWAHIYKKMCPRNQIWVFNKTYLLF